MTLDCLRYGFKQSRVISVRSCYLTSFGYLAFFSFPLPLHTVCSLRNTVTQPFSLCALPAALSSYMRHLLLERPLLLASRFTLWYAGVQMSFISFDGKVSSSADGSVCLEAFLSLTPGSDLMCALFARLKVLTSDESGYLYIGITLSGYNILY